MRIFKLIVIVLSVLLLSVCMMVVNAVVLSRYDHEVKIYESIAIFVFGVLIWGVVFYQGRKYENKLIFAAVLMIISTIFYVPQFFNEPPNRVVITKIKMKKIEELIYKFEKSSGRLPKLLGELAQAYPQISKNHKGNNFIDGWGNLIIYKENPPALISLGRDGEEGGTGFDSDISLELNPQTE